MPKETKIKNVLRAVKTLVLCGIGVVNLKDVCWFSDRYFDIHDYPEAKGGDGTPSHFYKYTCRDCSKKFSI